LVSNPRFGLEQVKGGPFPSGGTKEEEAVEPYRSILLIRKISNLSKGRTGIHPGQKSSRLKEELQPGKKSGKGGGKKLNLDRLSLEI